MLFKQLKIIKMQLSNLFLFYLLTKFCVIASAPKDENDVPLVVVFLQVDDSVY